ncbi:HNH endonuclease [Herbiconiux liukaitaii]|uniref:HNH endonuclease n=1 Tax=Herbiconiux liukaitaii TaxID=3342799 RepID=UPI0035B932E6
MKPIFSETPTTGSDAVERCDEKFRMAVVRFTRADRMIAALQARQAQALAQAVEACEARAEILAGSLTPDGREWARRLVKSEVATAARRSEGTIVRLITDAETLANDLPDTLAELGTGKISYAHARSMVAHATSLPAESRGSFEQAVLQRAKECNAARFDDAARRLRETHHPDSISQRAKKAYEDRAVWLDAERDGMATLHHHLPAVDALAIHDVLDQAARAARSDAEPRTQAQLRSDILANTILGRTDGALGFTPTIIVTVPAATMVGCEGDAGEESLDEHAKLHGYGPIDPDLARRLAAEAPTFLKVLVHPGTGDTIEVAGRYRIPAALREALIVADEHCRFPGCGRRAARCELDHTEDWALGGRSTASNLAHLCTSHHHLKHNGGWKVTRPPGAPPGSRELEWRSPLGATYRTTPPTRHSTAPPTQHPTTPPSRHSATPPTQQPTAPPIRHSAAPPSRPAADPPPF